MGDRTQPLKIRPVTARIGARLFPIVALDILVTISVPLLIFSIAYTLPDRYPYSLLRSTLGTFLLGVLSVILLGLLYIGIWLLFPAGKLTVDTAGIRWKINDDQGEIRWNTPFTLKRWCATYETSSQAYDTQGISLPAIVVEISQGNQRIAFWYVASKPTPNLPSGALRGYPLAHGAQKVGETLDRIWALRQRDNLTRSPSAE